MTADTPLRIMSMTKLVVTVAALQLAEQRKLDLDAPVEEYCPEFAELGCWSGSRTGGRSCAPRRARSRSSS